MRVDTRDPEAAGGAVARGAQGSVGSADVPERPTRWAFVGSSSLPADPEARAHEQRGRRWLAVSYALCPCHLPVVLAVLGAAFGGTAFGAALTGNAVRVGVVLTALYAVVLWRGFRQIRRAKRIEAAGGTLRCTPDGCTVEAPDRAGASVSASASTP